MYFQDDHFFNPILDAGCYYITLANIEEKRSGKPVDKTLIKNYALQEVLDGSAGNVAADMTIENANGVLQRFGSPLRQKLNNGSVEFPPDYICQEGEYEALKFQYVNAVSGTYCHFVMGDGNGKCIGDPISTGSNSVRLGKVVSKRIFA